MCVIRMENNEYNEDTHKKVVEVIGEVLKLVKSPTFFIQKAE